jgi:large subunit ribosomal protein L6
MSRIGRKPIEIPSGTTVTIDGTKITVKGKLGLLEREMHPRIIVKQEGNALHVERASDNKFDRSLHGLSRTLVANMITGVNTGFTKTLEIQGVGYRVELKPNMLFLNVGYSHPVEFDLPAEIKAEVDRNVIKLTGIDKERLGLVSAKLRAVRPPDNYKGKGIRYQNERIKLKPGKSGV